MQGILNKLDYLEDLGINAIYLNPIFESPSAHKYGAQFYHHIDNNFGPKPRKDELIWSKEKPSNSYTWQWTTADKLFLKLIKEAHHRGMKIIIDGVFNHSGIPFWAFQDVLENGLNSEFVDWFEILDFDDKSSIENEFNYEGWAGIKDLPVFKEIDGLYHPELMNYFENIVKRWMDPNNDGNPEDGIDGWRLDVAEHVNINFWREFRMWVDEINPNAYLTGEVWWENFWDNEMINAEPWLRGDSFHGVMNYRLADALFKFFIDDKKKISATEFKGLLENMISDYGYNNFLNVQNVLGSHDTERISSACINPDRWIDHANHLKYNPEFEIRKPNIKERRLQKLLVAFQFLFPGTPYVYYGDEVGMWGADDPDCRKPMIWEEYNYQDETVHSQNLPRPIDSVENNKDIQDFYKYLIGVRSSFNCLQSGDFKINLADNETGLFAFTRSLDNNSITAVFNGSNSKINFQIEELSFLKENCDYIDLNSHRPFNMIEHKSFHIWVCHE